MDDESFPALTIAFQRTLRIPDDGRFTASASLGAFPLRYVVVPGQPWLDGFSGRSDRADHPAGMSAAFHERDSGTSDPAAPGIGAHLVDSLTSLVAHANSPA